jgi:hypothetical protein
MFMQVKVARMMLISLLGVGLAIAQDNRPGETQVTVKGESVSIAFTAPHLKGRRVEDLLQHLRGTSWRLGADAATTLKTSVNLRFGSQVLQAGSYNLKAYRDELDRWWLRAFNAGEIAGNLPLVERKVDTFEDYLEIDLSTRGAEITFRVQWGDHELGGSFEVLN